jgi:hypothetical protein
MVDVYLSSLSNRMNDVMKVLTIIATIFIPLTFLAGVYGMTLNTARTRMALGYPAVMLGMAMVGISRFLYFKKRRWSKSPIPVSEDVSFFTLFASSEDSFKKLDSALVFKFLFDL